MGSPAFVRRDTLGGLLLGIGLGGFLDGIVLHQILQWHHMLTSAGGHPDTTVAGLEDNTLADGLFHLATWIAVAAGVWLLRRHGMPDGRRFAGLLLAGWGGFNLVEGLVDHQLLGLHHVREGSSELAYDVGFLAFGAALLVAGVILSTGTRRMPEVRSSYMP